MKAKTKTTKEQTPRTPKTAPATPEPEAKPKKATRKAKKERKAKPADRLPTSIEELKQTKSGLISYLLFSGKEKAEIVAEVQAAFRLGEAQAVKIVRRVSGRARLFQRVFQLMAAK